MKKTFNIIIGIQARSTSTRLPNKAMKPLGNKPILRHVIDSCRKSERFINEKSCENGLNVKTALLIPRNDPLKHKMKYAVEYIIEGDEDDVLSRYSILCDHFNPDYVVRITGDCALISSNLITKFIKLATQHELHYLSNVDEKYRTFFDGADCEVVSKEAMEWLFKNALLKRDREHVTIKLRESTPDFLKGKFGHVIGFLDLSHIKLSVDTEEDYQNVSKMFNSLINKVQLANNDELYPKVFRF